MKRDLAAILRGLGATTASALHAAGGNDDYARGYLAALVALATALDIPAHELRLTR